MKPLWKNILLTLVELIPNLVKTILNRQNQNKDQQTPTTPSN